MVWCRNGSICKEATPCDTLKCEFKKEINDVEEGIKQCDLYALTLPRHEWYSAVHIDGELRILKEEVF